MSGLSRDEAADAAPGQSGPDASTALQAADLTLAAMPGTPILDAAIQAADLPPAANPGAVKPGDHPAAGSVEAVDRRTKPRRTVMRLLRAAVALVPMLLAGCDAPPLVPGPALRTRADTAGQFVMPDGIQLPYRVWLPTGRPWAVVLALHGMNDSRDAWEYPGPDFAQAGVALFAPDQRGFGATDTRGRWPAQDRLTSDVRRMVADLQDRYPNTPVYLIGESMGAAILMHLGTEPSPPPVQGYILIAPAVWGRAKMDLLMRASLWLTSHTLPWLRLTGRGIVKVTASDNQAALRRLSNDPLTIYGTRIDAIRGLVDLMDTALAAAPRFNRPSLLLYGGRDELIPAKATAATWRALPAGPVRAFYPQGYHLLLRDLGRLSPISDILAWMRDPAAPLPSGADDAASAWLANQP